MTIAEILLQDYDIEMKNTRTTLERIPEHNPEFKCHEKSMPMGRLAAHVSTLPRLGKTILTTPELEMTTAKYPPLVFESREKLLDDFDIRGEARARKSPLEQVVAQQCRVRSPARERALERINLINAFS